MPQPRACRACAARTFWRVAPVMLPHQNASDGIYAMPVVCRSESGSTAPNEWGTPQDAGTFTAWICAGCGLTEWFAEGLGETLRELARVPDSGVTFMELDEG